MRRSAALPAPDGPQPSALALLCAQGTELLLAPSALQGLQAPATNPRAGAWDGDDEDAYKPYDLTAEGIAVLNIQGPLAQRAAWYALGYDEILSAFAAATQDAKVRAIVLRMSSPGGMVAGCFETVRSMRAVKVACGKRVVAVADESCYSGAYALATVADEIMVPESGGVGSVGVISMLASEAEANKKWGLDIRVITSGARKADHHPDVPISDEAQSREQSVVDLLAQQFFALVATSRSMSLDAVKALEAGCFYGRQAVSAGLADRVASFGEVLGQLRTTVAAPTAPSTTASTTPFTTPRGADPRRHRMEPIKTLLALGADATEADVTARVARLQQFERDVLGTTGADSPAAALGKVSAYVVTAGQLATVSAERDALLAEKAEAAKAAAKAAQAKELDDLIAQGVRDKKLTPPMAAHYRTRPIEELKAALPILPAIAVLGPAPRQPAPVVSGASGASGASGLPGAELATLMGTPYADLSDAQRNRFSIMDRVAHAQARDAWIAAGRPGAAGKRPLEVPIQLKSTVTG